MPVCSAVLIMAAGSAGVSPASPTVRVLNRAGETPALPGSAIMRTAGRVARAIDQVRGRTLCRARPRTFSDHCQSSKFQAPRSREAPNFKPRGFADSKNEPGMIRIKHNYSLQAEKTLIIGASLVRIRDFSGPNIQGDSFTRKTI